MSMLLIFFFFRSCIVPSVVSLKPDVGLLRGRETVRTESAMNTCAIRLVPKFRLGLLVFEVLISEVLQETRCV